LGIEPWSSIPWPVLYRLGYPDPAVD
jgi:hypothetical protein